MHTLGTDLGDTQPPGGGGGGGGAEVFPIAVCGLQLVCQHEWVYYLSTSIVIILGHCCHESKCLHQVATSAAW